MQFNEDDILRLIRSVEFYKEHTGSEWMWEQYDALAKKLRDYGEEYSTNDG
jgi:hypothetical protein